MNDRNKRRTRQKDDDDNEEEEQEQKEEEQKFDMYLQCHMFIIQSLLKKKKATHASPIERTSRIV
jgi:hypothetical protein